MRARIRSRSGLSGQGHHLSAMGLMERPRPGQILRRDVWLGSILRRAEVVGRARVPRRIVFTDRGVVALELLRLIWQRTIPGSTSWVFDVLWGDIALLKC